MKIISGGQTGAGRAALDFAIEHGFPHGGWCPKGRKSEDGMIAERYHLQEAPSDDYPVRSEWNVLDSDGTVVFSIAAELTGGSKKTLELAHRHQKPVLHLWRQGGLSSPEHVLARFITEHQIKVLNVAGPRASKEPAIAAFVNEVLGKTLASAGRTHDFETSSALPESSRQPTLETPRLLLRPFAFEDAPALARLAGRREIADTTISVPHPYSEQQAREWISHHMELGNEAKEAAFAIVEKNTGQLIGSAGLRDLNQEHSHAEMGCWIGVEFWGRGYATEAARALLQFGFEELQLNRIHAHHMLRNPASGRVLEKIGMRREGVLREAVRKWGKFEDVAILAVLNKDWPRRQQPK